MAYLNGQRAIVLPGSLDGSVSMRKRALASLFGSRNRTRLLIALMANGPASLNRLTAIASIPMRSGASALKHLEATGVARSGRVNQYRISELNPEFRGYETLKALLVRLGEAFPDIMNAAAIFRGHLESVEIEQRMTVAPGWHPELMPVGDDVQSAVLYALGWRGPLTTMALSKVTGRTINAARSAIVSLGRFGLVVYQIYGSGPTRKRWAALNPSHPLTPAITAYSIALARIFPSPPLNRLPPLDFPSAMYYPEIRPELPGMSTRLRLLMAIFERQEIDVQALRCRSGEMSHKRVTAWLNKFAAAGIINIGRRGALLFAAPNLGFAAYRELKDLVATMASFLRFQPDRDITIPERNP